MFFNKNVSILKNIENENRPNQRRSPPNVFGPNNNNNTNNNFDSSMVWASPQTKNIACDAYLRT